jgi:hypothetical protein
MPTYNTPNPIDLAINLQVGRIEVVASDRTDTIVTVTASSSKQNDLKAVDETKVTFDDQRLTVIGPKPKLSWLGPNAGDSVDIKVELPTGSRLTAENGGPVKTVGRFGATRIKGAIGGLDIEATGDLWLRAAHGGVTVGAVDGNLDVIAAYGSIRVGTVTGDAILRASYGGIQVGEAGGDLDAKLSYGDLEITKALGSVTAKTAFGGIQLGEVASGSIQVDSGYGQITIGVRPGVPAWLDLSSKIGHVRNELEGDSAPQPTEETVSVRARTQGGDITIQRAH